MNYITTKMTTTTGQSTLEKWKCRHYFAITDEQADSKNITVKCLLCPGVRTLSSAKNTTSNLKKHLDTVHKAVQLTTVEEANSRKRTSVDETSKHELHGKQQKIDFGKTVDKHKVVDLISEYVIEDMKPVSTVESNAFRNMITRITRLAGASINIPGRKTLVRHIADKYDKMNVNLARALDDISYVCSTADIWSASNRSFLGITIHWINPDTLSRKKAAISCERFKGRHTYDTIAARLDQINTKYKLNDKITATVTDNGSNFVKAFSVYEKKQGDLDIATHEEDNLTDCRDEANVEDEGLTEFTDMQEAMEQVPEEPDIVLPPHKRCASHTLNLLASKDIPKIMQSGGERQVYRSSLAKSSALWNRASRSPLASEELERVSSRKLIVPTETRWNSLYDALERLVSIGHKPIHDVASKLGIKPLTDSEMTFLSRYCDILKPVAEALDILQNEDNCYYGTILPTLYTLRRKLQRIGQSYDNATWMYTLPGKIIDLLHERFSRVFVEKEAKLAAISHPYFKNRWCDTQAEKDDLHKILLDEIRQTKREVRIDTPLPPDARHSKNDSKPEYVGFYDFTESVDITEDAETELAAYMRRENTVQSLANFPTVKQIFMKYNTTLPSSAPVERLFSLGGLILTPKRCRLSDEHFERLVLLRYNAESF